MKSRQMVYGRTAYEAFAKAIGAKLGIKVTVEHGSHAAINKEGIITLPEMSTYQTEEQFIITCGTVVHEMAHQFYGSHKLIDPTRSRIEHECLNTVLDVADETWISRWFEQGGNKRPGELLTRGNEQASTNSALWDWQNTASHLWKILCTGILDARVKSNRILNRIKRHNAHQARHANVNAKKVWGMIKKAKCMTQNVRPTPKRFKKLVELARALAVELAPFTPPEGMGTPVLVIGLPEALANGFDSKPSGAVEATAIEGAKATAIEGAKVASGQSKVGGATGSTGGGYKADPDSFRLLHPPVDRIARRIAVDGDGADLTDGLTNGPRVGQVHRLMTDGNCLARWMENEHAEGVSASILLDCSGSMSHQLSECAGIAKAFCEGMRECGPVQSLIFGTSCKETNSFDSVETLGGTRTDAAVAKATEWLKTRSGAKWIVCITDGSPDSQERLDARCQEAHAAGIKVLAIGLDCTITMPHATCVTAADVNHLAIELEAAARKIEAA